MNTRTCTNSAYGLTFLCDSFFRVNLQGVKVNNYLLIQWKCKFWYWDSLFCKMPKPRTWNPRNCGSIPGKSYSLFIVLTPQIVQTGSGAHTASNSIVAWDVLRGSEVVGSTVDHSLPPSAKLKKECRYAFNPSYAFMARIQTFLKNILRCVDEIHTVCVCVCVCVCVHACMQWCIILQQPRSHHQILCTLRLICSTFHTEH
jgi:hypothetical protein